MAHADQIFSDQAEHRLADEIGVVQDGSYGSRLLGSKPSVDRLTALLVHTYLGKELASLGMCKRLPNAKTVHTVLKARKTAARVRAR